MERYRWFRKQMQKYNDDYGESIPSNWNIQSEYALAFCNQMKVDVRKILSKQSNSLDAQELYTLMMNTIQFETELQKRYSIQVIFFFLQILIFLEYKISIFRINCKCF